MRTPRRYMPFVIAYTLYCMLLGLVFGRALFPGSTGLIFGDDVHRQYYFFRQFFLQSLQSGNIPWWNPYVFSGVPFLANAQVSMLYPLNWLYVLLPLPYAYSWYFYIHIAIATGTMFWLCRRWMDIIPSWAAGISFGLSGYFFARIMAGQPDVIAAAAWIPLVVGLSQRMFDKPTLRNALAASVGLLVQLSTGYQIITLFTLEAVGLFCIIGIVQRRSIKPLLYLLISICFALGLSAVQLLPQQEFFQHSIRTYNLPYSFTADGASAYKDFLTFLDPFILGDYRTYSGSKPNYHEHIAYFGRAPLVLAFGMIAAGGFLIIGVLLRRVTPEKLSGFGLSSRTFGVIISATLVSMGSLWISLGPNAPIDLQHIVWQLVPMYHYIRIPSRHLVLFVFSMSVLGAMGLQVIRVKWIQLLIGLYVVGELFLFSRTFIHVESLPESRHDSALVNVLTHQNELSRVVENFGVWIEPRNSLDFGSAMQYKFFSATGYDPSILRNYYEFIDATNGTRTPSVLTFNVQVPYINSWSEGLDYLNIKHIFLNSQYDPYIGSGDKRFKLLMDNKDRTYRLYENTTVLPRFYFVSNAKENSTRRDIIDAIIAGETLRTTVLLPPGVHNQIPNSRATDDRSTIRVNHYSNNSITLQTRTFTDSYLVSSEVMYPGWQAYIDGRQVPLVEGNVSFRTLFVPKGEHEIVITYWPGIYVKGGLISVISLVLWVLLWNKNNKRWIFIQNFQKRIIR